MLLFDGSDALALEMRALHLAGEPASTRKDFYRDLLDRRPFLGPDGLLAKFVNL